ncbi:MAG: efflux RND transporter periplasmic adaptor subunit [Verrucomicrobiota bacterium]
MKLLKPLFLVAVVIGLAFVFWPSRRSADRPAAGVSEARAEKRDIRETVEAAGFVRAVIYSSIRAQVSGPILKLHVETGDMVKKDQVLVELDPVLANADEEQARRSVQLQAFTLERLERDLRRVEILEKQGFVSQREVLDHRTAYEVAKLQRDIAQARLDTAVEMVRRTVIRAPHDGQVSDCNVLVGQIVIGAQSINNGTPLMTVSDTSVLRVDVNLNEFAATRVELGKDAVVTFDSIPGLRKTGKITFMTPFGTADLKVPDLRVFPTQVSFPAGDGVRPGISANVTVTVDSVKGCVAVPVSAVFIDGADRIVYVRGAAGEWDLRKVRLGLSDASWTQIREGVELGAVVSLVRPAPVR